MDYSYEIEGEEARRPLQAGLYLVATPIGNLRDITLRALDILKCVDMVFCEDTRTSRTLLQAYGIKTPASSYHDHSTESERQKIVDMIKSGKKIAYISDAGMPLVSDPGYALVQACIQEDLYVTSAPGANAVLTALQLSGLPADAFLFAGFTPNKTKARQDFWQLYKNTSATIIVYETMNRLEESLRDAREVLGNRKAVVARELTKKFEEIISGDIETLLARFAKDGVPKGECVLLIEGAQVQDASDEDIVALLKKSLKTNTRRDAVDEVVAATGAKKNRVYELALRTDERLDEK
ncbi:MAG: 16S rRNA (cytidine(1402)-2'-O)-methyltransferase [Alphaproteobacteria bacterium]|nr:16S rRNA (cytidine(1402)-2'-O)-methyltransferase [Alphaproteobacteria bacterium]